MPGDAANLPRAVQPILRRAPGLAVGTGRVTSSAMEFGWWKKFDDGKKYQMLVEVFGTSITWSRKHGHNTSWEPYRSPTDEDWDKLIGEAERRVPRRLFTKKQFEFILSQRPK
jgi:hypothetical protein